MSEHIEQNKWEGKTCAEMKGATADQVWPFLADFCNFSHIDTCYQVEGPAGKPGMVRYCSSSMMLDGGETKVMWAKEKVISMDEKKRCLSYEVVDNNVGFGLYKATFKVVNLDDGGCMLEWSFICDPAQGWTYESLCSYREVALQTIVKKMEAALRN